MSSEKENTEDDPMIEDILSSIKSIINEDGEEQVTAEEPQQPQPQPRPRQEQPVAPAMVVDESMPDFPDNDFEESIISSATADIGTQQFVKLNNMIRMGNSNVTLSDIVRSLLRPMLREWLDENLPPMVEQKVEYEIKRLVNRIDKN